jgi:hypothetical protein
MKKLFALILALALCATLALASAESVYVKEFTTDELTSNTFHNGFVTALKAVEVNTLTLKDDGTYVYVKELLSGSEEDPGMKIIYTFTGTYTQDGDTVVLAFPTNVKFSENWGNLVDLGYFLNSEGAAVFENDEISGDIVQCKEEESHVAFDIFPGVYLNDSLATSDAAFDAEECTVTVTLSGDTFDYVIVNSDDD